MHHLAIKTTQKTILTTIVLATSPKTTSITTAIHRRTKATNTTKVQILSSASPTLTPSKAVLTSLNTTQISTNPTIYSNTPLANQLYRNTTVQVNFNVTRASNAFLNSSYTTITRLQTRNKTKTLNNISTSSSTSTHIKNKHFKERMYICSFLWKNACFFRENL